MDDPGFQTRLGPKWDEYVEKTEKKLERTNSGSVKNKVELPEVFVKIKIYSLGKIDLDEKYVNLDFSIMTDWIDPSVDVADPEHLDIEKDHFSPCVSISNCFEPTPSVTAGGECTCRMQKSDKTKPKSALQKGHVKRAVRYNTKM